MSEIIIEMPPDFSHQVPGRDFTPFSFAGFNVPKGKEIPKQTQMSSVFFFFWGGLTDLNHFMSQIFRNLWVNLVVGTITAWLPCKIRHLLMEETNPRPPWNGLPPCFHSLDMQFCRFWYNNFTQTDLGSEMSVFVSGWMVFKGLFVGFHKVYWSDRKHELWNSDFGSFCRLFSLKVHLKLFSLLCFISDWFLDVY